ncbi:hypothetical protein GC102_08310 [Paenibacillus sp. LMG 31460]|uniref:Fungal lipase-type domain-containing protein n=1 Tax=Paenibacillus germinis TaxID=2654979 RepID=A0ABX1Z1K5_9BACL|nr:alpha/beta hydrolase [Paenibacillus germinis]NOU85775.1 hypothetical protein [Paenibacillus germinis]
MTIHSEPEEFVIYVSAGFATAPYFLDAFAAELAARFEQAGSRVQVVIHYPYGDWTRRKQVQLREITSDLWNNAHRKRSHYGGKSLLKLIKDNQVPKQQLLLIGHSAGAVASILAADALMKEGVSILGVVQIGSPKCAIPPSLKSRVLYLDAANQLDKSNDPVPRLGTWGGWMRIRLGLRRWNGMKHAPSHRQTLPLIGGHADYFRDHNPYIWNEATNLQTTMNTIWTWLQRIEKDDEHD